ncbi:hypothetical protein EDD36DRAFT_469387 [Exophiala viscosa]|uniref:Uncharacterized protein n=1 Tax=Exophiala viscosa TaxID=2486360 RepID=A0AAN6DMA6_9EURO|nr:hypothetical protein EDD36DRAFT_469387 [Exophiala viscosa]
MAASSRQGNQQVEQQTQVNESASTIPPSDLAELNAFIDSTLEHQSPSVIAALVTDNDMAPEPEFPLVNGDQHVPDVAAYFQSTMSVPRMAPTSSNIERKRNASVAFEVDEYNDENDDWDTDDDMDKDDDEEVTDEPVTPKKRGYQLRKAKDDVTRVKPPSKHSKRRGAVWHRERREVEDDDRKKLCEKIDDDILQQVDDAGGSTPAGRVFRSALLMIERLQQAEK